MARKTLSPENGAPGIAYYRCIYAMFLIGAIDLLFASISFGKMDAWITNLLLADGILTILLCVVASVRPGMWPLYLAALLLIIDVVWIHLATAHLQNNPLGRQAL